MPRQKVFFLNRFFAPDESATSLMLTDLAYALSDRGDRIQVITSRLRSDDPGVELACHEIRGNLEIHRVKGSRFGRANLLGRAIDYLTFYISAAWQLARLASANDIVIANTDPPLLATVVAPISRWRKAQLVNWIQDLYPETAAALGIISPTNPLFRVARALRDKTVRGAVANVVIGERMAGLLRERGVPGEHIVVIPNWADERNIRPIAHSANPLRRKWIARDAFVVAYSGNMGRAHALSTLIDAARLSATTRPALQSDPAVPVRFLFVGDGHQRKALENEVRNQRLANVIFKPFQPREKLSESLAVGDLHVVSLKPEAEGLIVPSKLYGILAAGRPVLFMGDEHSEVAWLLHRFRCGFHVPPGDPAAIHDAICAYIGDPRRLAREGRNARLLFESAFSRQSAVSHWASLLDSLRESADSA